MHVLHFCLLYCQTEHERDRLAPTPIVHSLPLSQWRRLVNVCVCVCDLASQKPPLSVHAPIYHQYWRYAVGARTRTRGLKIFACDHFRFYQQQQQQQYTPSTNVEDDFLLDFVSRFLTFFLHHHWWRSLCFLLPTTVIVDSH